MAEFIAKDGRRVAVTLINKQSDDELNGYRECLSQLSTGIPDYAMAKWLIMEKYYHGDHILVAKHDGVVIGTATGIFERKISHNGKTVLHIEDVVVKDGWRGLGIGKFLVNELVQYARERGAYKCVLEAASNLQGYYQSLGFSQAGISMRLDL